MFKRFDYEFEYYEKYYGNQQQVREKVENCPKCGEKMIMTHFCDTGNLLVEETVHCNSCDFGQRKIIHILN